MWPFWQSALNFYLFIYFCFFFFSWAHLLLRTNPTQWCQCHYEPPPPPIKWSGYFSTPPPPKNVFPPFTIFSTECLISVKLCPRSLQYVCNLVACSYQRGMWGEQSHLQSGWHCCGTLHLISFNWASGHLEDQGSLKEWHVLFIHKGNVYLFLHRPFFCRLAIRINSVRDISAPNNLPWLVVITFIGSAYKNTVFLFLFLFWDVCFIHLLFLLLFPHTERIPQIFHIPRQR